jgi:hypothetical protein
VIERVTDLTDPRRCKGAAPDGQCQNVSEYGSDYCPAHGGRTGLEEAEDKRGYLLAKAEDRTRLVGMADKLEPVKELRDLIALQHMLIEKRYNLINSDTDLLTACGPLNTMLTTMERLISSCHRVETNLGELLQRHAVLTLAKEMVRIVIDELEGIENYEYIVDQITQRLIDTIRNASNVQEKSILQLPAPLEDDQ